MSRPIDADALEKDGWKMSRTVRISKDTMEWQTRKPTDFPTIEPHEWIPCSERLPEEQDEYLVTWVTKLHTGKWFVGIGIFEYDLSEDNRLFDDYMKAYIDVTVTAWMPLPEPYKEGQDTNQETVKLLRTIKGTVYLGNRKFEDAISYAISALEQPIEPQRIRGRWKTFGWNGVYCECSECGNIYSYQFNFCPFCGADMRGGQDVNH